MTNPKSPTAPYKYYFCDDATLTVHYCDNMNEGQNMVYLGTSNNPDIKMAVSAFTQQGKITSGYRIQKL
jgi:hypothetical protein